jgi:hypothetical protein
MTVAQGPPRQASAPARAPAPEAPSREDAKSGEVVKGKNHWIVIKVTPEQSKALREMARTSGGKAGDFYRELFSPAIDVAVKDFAENREARTAQAKARQARLAAQRAQDVAKKAEEEAARIGGQKSP